MLNLRGGGTAKPRPKSRPRGGVSYDEHIEESRLAQRQADKWLISGSLLIGTAALGIFGFRCSSAGSGCCGGHNGTGSRFGPCSSR